MKYRWGREEEYTVCCKVPGRKKKNWIAWLKAGVWKLKETGRGTGWIKVVVLHVTERKALEHAADSSGNKKPSQSIYV